MEYLFVMLINTDPSIPNWQYVGNFNSCDKADLYVELNHPDKVGSRCLMKEYVYLPEGFEFVNKAW
tara:strand:+ start:139 stop:336 length:198 start_codon:yes stop_codon:yes gene_type:complete